jgi:ketosteroid isomerase-like protein
VATRTADVRAHWHCHGGRPEVPDVRPYLPGGMSSHPAVLASAGEVTTDVAAAVKALELQRVRALLEADLEVAERLHAPDYQVVDPRGGTHTRDEYLAGVATGALDYRRFEAVTEIEVMASGDLAVLHYRSGIDILVAGLAPQSLEAWQTVCYRRTGGDARWQVVWQQETAVSQA